MKVLALWGKANSGKSATLAKLRVLLLRDGAVELTCQVSSKSPQDMWCVLRYRGKTIGLTMCGDNESVIKPDFDAIEDECKNRNIDPVDMYICASRTGGGSCKAVRDLLKTPSDELVWIAKNRFTMEKGSLSTRMTVQTMRDHLNTRQAEDLLEIVKAL